MGPRVESCHGQPVIEQQTSVQAALRHWGDRYETLNWLSPSAAEEVEQRRRALMQCAAMEHHEAGLQKLL